MDLSLWPSILPGGWGHGTWACAQAETWQDDPCPLPARCLPPSWWAAMDGLPSAGLFAHCAGEGKWAPGSCRPAMDVLAAGDRTVAAVSWRPLPGPAGARFAVEKQLGAAWHPASRLPLPPLLWQSVYPAVSPGTGDSEGMCTEFGARWLSGLGPGVACREPAPGNMEGSGASGLGLWWDPRLAHSMGLSPQVLWGALIIAWLRTHAREPRRGQALSLCLSCPQALAPWPCQGDVGCGRPGFLMRNLPPSGIPQPLPGHELAPKMSRDVGRALLVEDTWGR